MGRLICHNVTWQFRSHAVCDPKFGKEISKLPRIHSCLNQTGPRYVWLWVSTRSFRASHTTRLCHVSIEEFDNLCSLMLDLRMRFPTCACFHPNNTPFWRAHCTVLELSTVVLSIETYEDVACFGGGAHFGRKQIPKLRPGTECSEMSPNGSNNQASRSNALNRTVKQKEFQEIRQAFWRQNQQAALFDRFAEFVTLKWPYIYFHLLIIFDLLLADMLWSYVFNSPRTWLFWLPLAMRQKSYVMQIIWTEQEVTSHIES